MKKLKHIYLVLLLMLSLQTFAQHTQVPKVEWLKTLGGNGYSEPSSSVIDHEGNLYVAGCFFDSLYTAVDTLIASSYWDPFIAKYNTEGDIIWIKQFVGPIYNDYIQSITIDNDDNLIIAGNFTAYLQIGDTTIYSAGDLDIFIVKLTLDSKILWAEREGYNFREGVSCIKTDSQNNIYLTGAFENYTKWGDTLIRCAGGIDLFLAKLNQNGQFQWIRQEGQGMCTGYALCLDNANNIYVTGYSNNNLANDTNVVHHGAFDILLMKFGNNGICNWAKLFGSTNDEIGQSIAVDSLNNIYFSGRFNTTCTFDQITITADSIAAYIAKCDSAGTIIWAKDYNSGEISPETFIFNNKNLYFLCTFRDTIQVGDTIIQGGRTNTYFAKVNQTNGNIGWVKTFTSLTGSLAINGCNTISLKDTIFYFIGDMNSSVQIDSLQVTGRSIIFISKLKQKHNSVGIYNLETENLKVYPNPSNGLFYIDLSNIYEKNSNVIIYNTMGQIIYKNTITNIQNYTYLINVEYLTTGIYHVMIQTQNRNYYTKILIQ